MPQVQPARPSRHTAPTTNINELVIGPSSTPHSHAPTAGIPKHASQLHPQTRNIIKGHLINTGMMNASKLSNMQQQFLDTFIHRIPTNTEGEPFPARPVRGMNGFNIRQSEIAMLSRHASRAAEVSDWYLRPPAIRTLSQIQQSGGYSTEEYRYIPTS
jgi:hypothetical protein